MLTYEQVARFKEEGYAISRGVLTSKEVGELSQACDDLAQRAQTFASDTFVGVTFFNMHRDANPFAANIGQAPVVKGQIRRVTYPYALHPTFDRYRRHPRLLGCAAALLGPDLKQIVNQVNFNPPGSGSGWGWHQDYRFRKAGIPDLVHDFVQTIIALDLCSPFTGGLRLVPKSHALGGLKLDQDNENAEKHFDASLAISPELAPGDVILFNSHVIHGSNANKSPHQRRVYINGYARATATVGMPVMKAGTPIETHEGKMEYEGDQESLPKASKY